MLLSIALYLAAGFVYAVVTSGPDDWQWSRAYLFVSVVLGWPWLLIRGVMK
jgi:hypothetical protein